MITFKPIVVQSNRRRDGTYPVKIRVYYKGKVRRLPTTLVCTQNDLTRSLKIKNPTILSKGNALIDRMRKAVQDIPYFDLERHDVDWLVARIRDCLEGERFSLDFFEWGRTYISSKTESTQRNYRTAMSALSDFLGSETLDINDITRSMLLDFMENVDSQPKRHYNPSSGTYTVGKSPKLPRGVSSRHLVKLEHIFNAAKERYNDEDSGRIVIPRSPFSSIKKTFPPSQGQKNLGMEVMQTIIKAQTSDHLTRIALDAFIVSFGLMGANLADLYFATPVDGVWVYNRQKTRTRRADRAEMQVVVPEELKPYIERLQEHQGAWWLPTLHWLGSTKDLCTGRINRILSRWCRDNGLPSFTFYAARHTWASVARSKARVEKALVDECLCHKGDYETADIYIERDWELINEANQKVVELFEW